MKIFSGETTMYRKYEKNTHKSGILKERFNLLPGLPKETNFGKKRNLTGSADLLSLYSFASSVNYNAIS